MWEEVKADLGHVEKKIMGRPRYTCRRSRPWVDLGKHGKEEDVDLGTREE